MIALSRLSITDLARFYLMFRLLAMLDLCGAELFINRVLISFQKKNFFPDEFWCQKLNLF